MEKIAVRYFVDEASKCLEHMTRPLDLIKKQYKGNPEVEKVIDDLIDAFRKSLGPVIQDYAKFALSHISNVESVEIISEEYTKKLLERLNSTR